MKYYVRIARYTVEKNIIQRYEGSYGLVFPSNILSFYGNSIREFLITTKKSYFIDPMTYIFLYPYSIKKEFEEKVDGETVKKEDYKKSYKKLFNCYSDEIKKRLENQGLSIDFFKNDNNIKIFVNNTLDYQKKFFLEKPSKIKRYESMIKEGTDLKVDGLNPKFLCIPYFYFRDLQDDWYQICKKMVDHAKKLSSESKIYGVLCFDKNLLMKSDEVEKMIQDFDDLDGYLTIVSGFDENKEDIAYLEKFRDFISDLYNSYKKPIINLFGGYFSVLLKYYGLYGFSSGLVLNESKDVTRPAGTGRLLIRFYLPLLHSTLTETQMDTYFTKYNFIEDCVCDNCTNIKRIINTPIGKKAKRKVIASMFKNKRLMIDTSLGHFLSNRNNETKFISEKGLSDAISDLEVKIKRSEKLSYKADFGKKPDHLKRWLNVLK